MITTIALALFWFLVACLGLVCAVALFIGFLILFNLPK